MGDLITGARYLFLLGRGECFLLLAAWVIWLAFCLVVNSLCVLVSSRGLLGEQSVSVDSVVFCKGRLTFGCDECHIRITCFSVLLLL